MEVIKYPILFACILIFFSCKTNSVKEQVRFYTDFNKKDRISSPDDRLIERAAKFGKKVVNGCFESSYGVFEEKDVDSVLVNWIKEYETSWFCEKQVERGAKLNEFDFIGAYSKQKAGNDYSFYVFKASHYSNEGYSKVSVSLNQRNQLYSVNCSSWK